jgi:endonuclease-3
MLRRRNNIQNKLQNSCVSIRVKFINMKSAVEKLLPLIEKYGKKKHPLNYDNRYQLLCAVVLAAQATDSQVNKIAPEFFRQFPSMEILKTVNPEDLFPYLSSIRGFRKKSEWLVKVAKTVGSDQNIPHDMKGLTRLPGVGRKSANVIIRESGDKAEGIAVDLHVVRVAPRLGIVDSMKPDNIEKELMEALPQDIWNDAGMALSFHGREICRPKPKCEECIVRDVCDYYRNIVKR